MAKRRAAASGRKKPVAKNRRPARSSGAATASNRRKVTTVADRLGNSSSGSGAAASSRPMPKTKLKPEELAAFKRLLLEKRRQLVGDVGNMEAEALKKKRTDAAGDLSMMPIHMADIGTDNYEQEFTIGLIENEREIVKEIDAALARIANGTYGICEGTRKPIAKTRLKAKPWARYCVAYRRSQEENGP